MSRRRQYSSSVRARINLSFNVSDPAQMLAYRYLKSQNKNATQLVLDALYGKNGPLSENQKSDDSQAYEAQSQANAVIHQPAPVSEHPEGVAMEPSAPQPRTQVVEPFDVQYDGMGNDDDAFLDDALDAFGDA